VGSAFMDDVDLLMADNTQSWDAQLTTESMQLCLDRWEYGLRASGGALSAAKSWWTLIDFDWEGTKWCYSTENMKPANLYMTDFTGVRLPLHRMTSSEAKWTLGV